jgi:hypothetical protein
VARYDNGVYTGALGRSKAGAEIVGILYPVEDEEKWLFLGIREILAQ